MNPMIEFVQIFQRFPLAEIVELHITERVFWILKERGE